ncbi:MAG: lipoprotein insertase outer membrane protein LolB [Arsenophonus sp.]
MVLTIKQCNRLCNYCWNFILLFVIFLSSCTFNHKLTSKKNNLEANQLWINHQKQLTKITKFQTSGSLSYISVNNKIYTKFFFQQYTQSNYSILFTNLLGIAELELNVIQNVIYVIDKEGKRYVNNHPEQIIYQLTGIKINIKNLSHLLIGLPSNSNLFTLDENGLLKTVKYMYNEEALNVKYITYYQNRKIRLPKIIELTEDKYRIKLIIDSWAINE